MLSLCTCPKTTEDVRGDVDQGMTLPTRIWNWKDLKELNNFLRNHCPLEYYILKGDSSMASPISPGWGTGGLNFTALVEQPLMNYLYIRIASTMQVRPQNTCVIDHLIIQGEFIPCIRSGMFELSQLWMSDERLNADSTCLYLISGGEREVLCTSNLIYEARQPLSLHHSILLAFRRWNKNIY